jgi:hypothetical protein
MRYLFILLIFIVTLFAQQHRCDWQVWAMGGGDVSGVYQVGITVGQTAIGWMMGNFLAHIGFWQTLGGIPAIKEKEKFRWQDLEIKETKLFPPFPNPFYRTTQIHYLLDKEKRVVIEIYDITGRIVKVLINETQKRGRYTANWDGSDNTGKLVANGVYICRFIAGDYQKTTKLIFQR